MSVELTQEQREFADLANNLLTDVCSVESLVRERDGVPDRHRWAQMAEVGLTGATVPEAYGGMGLSARDLVLVAEEAGYFALPEPLIESVCVAVPILIEYAPLAIQEKWLPRVASGEAIIALQAGVDGAASFGQFADLVLVVEDSGVALCEKGDSPAVTLESSDILRRPARITPARNALRIGNKDVAAELTARATVFSAVMLNGVSRRLLDMSIEYAKLRSQFGRPIGGFQAVKHMLADVAVELETARPSAWFAAGLDSDNIDALRVSASVAKWSASTAGSTANYVSLQVHGGIGFTRENPLSVWLLRAKAMESQWGSVSFHARFLGESLMRADSVVDAFGPSLE